jgi:hypothetical protein
MNKSLIAAVSVFAASAGAVLLFARGGILATLAPQAQAADRITWRVGYTKELDPKLAAAALQAMDGGGRVNIVATCNSGSDGSSVTLDFSYFSKGDKGDGAVSRFDSDAQGDVAVLYRIDGSQTRQANSHTGYWNIARVMFAYVSPNAKVDPADALVIGLSGSYQDLQPFLHAREMKFQLPLGGGRPGIVSLSPQDSGFRAFLSQCKIDLGSIDAETATHQALQDGQQQRPNMIDYGILGKPDPRDFADVDPDIATRSAEDNLTLFRKHERDPLEGASGQPMNTSALAKVRDYRRALFYAAATGAASQITPQDWQWVRADEEVLKSFSCELAGSPGDRYGLTAQQCRGVR